MSKAIEATKAIPNSHSMFYQFLSSPVKQELTNQPQGNPFPQTSVLELTSNLLDWTLVLAGIYVFVCIAWSGLQWMFAGDDTNAISASKGRLTHCLIGFGVLASTFALSLLVQYFIGTSVIEVPVDYSQPAGPCQAGLCASGQNCIDNQCYWHTPTPSIAGGPPTNTPTPDGSGLPAGSSCNPSQTCQAGLKCGWDRDNDTYFDQSSINNGECIATSHTNPYQDCQDNPNIESLAHLVRPGQGYSDSVYTNNDGNDSGDWNCIDGEEIHPQDDNTTNLPSSVTCAGSKAIIENVDGNGTPGRPGWISAIPACGQSGSGFRICIGFNSVIDCNNNHNPNPIDHAQTTCTGYDAYFINTNITRKLHCR